MAQSLLIFLIHSEIYCCVFSALDLSQFNMADKQCQISSNLDFTRNKTDITIHM